MFDTISDTILTIDTEDVLQKAREYGLNVKTPEDFRAYGDEYHRIEEIMKDYQSSFSFYNSLGGLTAGIGGFSTAVALTSIDILSFTIQVYHLTQRFAILNGFDREDLLHREKMMNIYFEALGINVTAQSVLKAKFVRASAISGTKRASRDLVLRLIIRVAKVFGKTISTRKAGQLIPVFGGLIGAAVNKTLAETTGNSIREAYKETYIESWHRDESEEE